jgi:hypothetical protein
MGCDHCNYFMWLTKKTSFYLLEVWPITAALGLSVVVALFICRRRLSHLMSRKGVGQLMPLAIPLVILSLGSWFECRNCNIVAHEWAMTIIWLLLLIHVFWSSILVRISSPCRVVSACFQALLLWIAYWVAVVANEPGPFL